LSWLKRLVAKLNNILKLYRKIESEVRVPLSHLSEPSVPILRI
jgi:hypothetical protein